MLTGFLEACARQKPARACKNWTLNTYLYLQPPRTGRHETDCRLATIYNLIHSPFLFWFRQNRRSFWITSIQLEMYKTTCQKVRNVSRETFEHNVSKTHLDETKRRKHSNETSPRHVRRNLSQQNLGTNPLVRVERIIAIKWAISDRQPVVH